MSEPRCVHCKRNKGHRKMRWLCNTCWRDKSIRECYPKRNHGPTTSLDWSKLTPAIPDRCVHGIKDGLCAICEKAQRATMVMEAEEEEIEAA